MIILLIIEIHHHTIVQRAMDILPFTPLARKEKYCSTQQYDFYYIGNASYTRGKMVLDEYNLTIQWITGDSDGYIMGKGLKLVLMKGKSMEGLRGRKIYGAD